MRTQPGTEMARAMTTRPPPPVRDRGATDGTGEGRYGEVLGVVVGVELGVVLGMELRVVVVGMEK